MGRLAYNDTVELTWWDEYDSKEYTEIELLSENPDGTGDRYIRVGETTFSIDGWKSLIDYLNLCVIDDQSAFIKRFGNNHQ